MDTFQYGKESLVSHTKTVFEASSIHLSINELKKGTNNKYLNFRIILRSFKYSEVMPRLRNSRKTS